MKTTTTTSGQTFKVHFLRRDGAMTAVYVRAAHRVAAEAMVSARPACVRVLFSTSQPNRK